MQPGGRITESNKRINDFTGKATQYQRWKDKFYAGVLQNIRVIQHVEQARPRPNPPSRNRPIITVWDQTKDAYWTQLQQQQQWDFEIDDVKIWDLANQDLYGQLMLSSDDEPRIFLRQFMNGLARTVRSSTATETVLRRGAP